MDSSRKSSSLVHTVETTPSEASLGHEGRARAIQPISYQERLRSKCRVEWQAAVNLYAKLDKAEHRSRSWNLHECRTHAWFAQDLETNLVCVISNHCSLRWCPLCAQAKANYIRRSVSDWLPRADHPKFLTMTLKHSKDPLSDQVTKLYESFQRLRDRKEFGELVTGGVWFFQLCRNTQRGEWHPHLHCIITGQYIPYQLLRKMWLEITGDSDVVDVRAVRDLEYVASEVARYASRPAKLSDFGMKHQLELYEAMHGKRLCGKWGHDTKVELSVKRNRDLKRVLKVGSWEVVTQFANVDPRAKAILDAYENQTPLAPGTSLQRLDDFIDDFHPWKPDELTVDLPPPEKTLF
ncbi:hypothetical protein ES703_73382 [subsurface metagenome]